MSTIEIRHPHSLAPAQARKAVKDFAVKLGERFGLDYRWEGDVMHFKRTGVDGHIALQPGELLVNAKLGLLFSAMKGRSSRRCAARWLNDWADSGFPCGPARTRTIDSTILSPLNSGWEKHLGGWAGWLIPIVAFLLIGASATWNLHASACPARNPPPASPRWRPCAGAISSSWCSMH